MKAELPEVHPDLRVDYSEIDRALKTLREANAHGWHPDAFPGVHRKSGHVWEIDFRKLL